MTVRPFMKFYPSDWRAEPRLRMCSLAARGLWIDLISYMHEGEPYGHLTINGASPGIDDMAALVSRPIKEVQKAFDELEARQVFSVNEFGVIYSRRMIRDHDRSEEGRKQVAKRWPDREPSNPPNRSPNRSDDETLLLRSQKLEARKKESKEDTADAVSPPIAPYAFESGVIRLNQKDFDRWKQAFSHLDLGAELLSLSQWAEEQGSKWFHAVSGALAKRNRELGLRLEQQNGPQKRPFDWREAVL